jgi:hypothetical protein
METFLIKSRHFIVKYCSKILTCYATHIAPKALLVYESEVISNVTPGNKCHINIDMIPKYYGFSLSECNNNNNNLRRIQIKTADWIDHNLCKKCLLKHVIEGKIEERIELVERRRRRSKQLLDDFKEMRRYWKFKEEALDRTVWRTRFGRGYGLLVRETMKRMNGCVNERMTEL